MIVPVFILKTLKCNKQKVTRNCRPVIYYDNLTQELYLDKKWIKENTKFYYYTIQTVQCYKTVHHFWIGYGTNSTPDCQKYVYILI